MFERALGSRGSRGEDLRVHEPKCPLNGRPALPETLQETITEPRVLSPGLTERSINVDCESINVDYGKSRVDPRIRSDEYPSQGRHDTSISHQKARGARQSES